MGNVQYVHYGANEFKRWKFKEIKNQDFGNKPRTGGLWASRVNADYGWNEWCENEGFRTYRLRDSFRFTLSDNAKIFEIHSVKDLAGVPKLKSEFPAIDEWANPDFEQLIRDGYDAIELFLSEDFRLYWSFYGWDCDSVLIMNKNIIIPQ